MLAKTQWAVRVVAHNVTVAQKAVDGDSLSVRLDWGVSLVFANLYKRSYNATIHGLKRRRSIPCPLYHITVVPS